MKTKYKIVIMVLLFIMGGNFFWYNLILDYADQDYQSVNGSVDLSGWNMDESIQALNGQWRYYNLYLLEDLLKHPEVKSNFALVQIPEFKKGNVQESFERYGTYVLDVTGLEPNKAYGIYSREQVTAYRLTINSNTVLENGVVGRNIGEMVPEWNEKSSTVFTDALGHLHIYMEISNFEYDDGIFWNSIVIGSPEKIFKYHTNQLISEILLLVGFLFIALLFMSLFVYFKLEKNLFYFSLFTFNISLRLMFTSSRPIVYFWDSISWNTVVRIEYLTGYLMLPLIVLFVTALIDFKLNNLIRKVSFITIGIFSVMVIFTTHHFYTSILFPFIFVSITIIVGALISIIFMYRKNKFYEIILVLSFSNFLIAMFKQLSDNLISWVPISVFNAVLGLSVILLNSFWTYFKENEVMAIKATIDPLTGLYNRHYFHEFGKNMFDMKFVTDHSYVMFLDLDGFKKVNDEFGHENGDIVLRIIGHRIRHCLRNDDLIFRYGGDEFVVLTNSEDQRHVELLTNRLIQAIGEPIINNGNTYEIGVSIGVIRCSKDENMSLEDYIRISDNAMYKAKQKGGNCYYYA